MSLEHRVYAVTGGASGIGLATAKLIAHRGGAVCIADVSHPNDESEFSMVSKVDVSDRQQVEDWIADIKNRFGRLDGAANVAGIIGKHHGVKTVAELEDEEWHRIMNVNLTGMMYCLRAELNNITDGGSIVNMASIHATTGTCPHHPASLTPQA